MGKVIVKGFLSEKEVNELNRGGGFRIITGGNLNPLFIKQLKMINNRKSSKKNRKKPKK